MKAHALLLRWGPAALALGTLLAAMAVVESLIRAGVIDPYTVPLPSEILAAFGRVFGENDVPARFVATAGETLAAGLLLVAVGIPLGALLYGMPILRAACETWVAAMAAAPIVLMYPLFLVIFGRTTSTIVAMGFLPALPAVILKTVEGLAGTRPVLIRVGESLNLTRRQLFWKILLPAAIPSIFTGLRLGLTFALINIVGVEFLINFGGLGQLVSELGERYDLPGTYAAIGFVVLVSVVFFAVLERIERWLRPTP
jgi:ABC-type nitrate/sulfonate/bicarbonate transport system permease component